MGTAPRAGDGAGELVRRDPQASAPDPASVASDLGLMDEGAVRSRSGDGFLTATRLVELGVLHVRDVDRVLSVYHDWVLAAGDSRARCGACGETLVRKTGALRCTRCGRCLSRGPEEPAEGPDGAQPEASSVLGPYVLRHLLGHGAFGTVHLAYDRKLRRHVALKVLNSFDPIHLARFHQEAEILGRLRHPNIACVHDVGEVHGRAYLAMEYIDGRTLAEERPPLRNALEWTRDAASAIHVAHGQGIVHRDLKPGNLMVDASGRVFVLDFGLARDPGAERELTETGELIGTPAFMSPEQAGGRLADARSDVYGLGATLYALAAGRPPYEGSRMDVVRQILTSEPPLPRKVHPSIPPDVQAVILKAMERDPLRRYATAGDLAEDLNRCLVGDPVRAQRPTPLYGLRRRVRRHPWTWTLGVAAAALVLVAGAGSALGLRVISRERADALQEMRRVSELSWELALEMRKTGDLGRMQQYLATVRDACEKAIRRAPRMAEPHYRLGRMFRSAMMWPEALRQQDLALQKDPDHAGARYERALLAVRSYGDALECARARWWAREGERLWEEAGGGIARAPLRREPTRDDLEREAPDAVVWRNRAMEDLVRAGDRGTARALHAWLEGRVEDARRLFQQANDEDPDLEEPYEWLGTLARTPEEAERWFTEGIRRDRGYLPYRWGRAAVRRMLADRSSPVEGGDRAEALYDAAQQDCLEAVQMDPDRVESLASLAGVRVHWGLHRMARGEDSSELFAAAIEDYSAVLQRDPTQDRNWCGRAAAFLNWATHKMRRGEDPIESLAASMRDYGEVLRRNPGRDDAWRGRAVVRANWGRHLDARGQDATPLYEAAIQDFEEALRRNPGRAATWSDRGDARVNAALHQTARGRDAGEGYRAAIEDYSQALRLDAEPPQAWRGRGIARAQWARNQANRGSDPSPLFALAVEDLLHALRLAPESARTRIHLAGARLEWGTRLSGRGEDPTPLYAAAIEDCTKALDQDRTDPEAWRTRGNARLNRGAYASRRGDDPDDWYRGAVEDFGEALRRNPNADETWASRGRARANWGASLGWRGGDPTSLYREALEDYDAALRLNPHGSETWIGRARVRINWGAYTCGHGGDPTPLYRRAIEDCAEALRRDPDREEAWLTRGLALTNHATYELRRGEDPTALYQEAIGDCTESLRRNAQPDETWLRRAEARIGLGRYASSCAKDPTAPWEAAIEDLSEALRRNPSRDETWRSRGTARGELALYRQARGLDVKELLDAAREDLERAVERNPSGAENWLGLGRVRHVLGDWAGALSCFEQGCRLDPALGTAFRSFIQDCRRRAEGEEF